MGQLAINLKTFNLILENNFADNKIIFDYFRSIYNIKIKDIEVDCIKSLVDNLNLSSKYLEGFFISYTIPKISKEFDLLRIDNKKIINIEIKSSSTKLRVKKQLLQNEYYLSFLGKKFEIYSYIKNTNILYKLENGELIITEFKELRKDLIDNYNNLNHFNIDNLFNPSNYLVSPFNATDKFLGNRYFLTSHQEYIKKVILRDILYKDFNYFYIEGSSGTGKTLLVYDIARSLMKMGKKIAIIHVGQLNKGQEILIKMGWDIFKITELNEVLKKEFRILILDEAQRLELEQVNMIMDNTKVNKTNCIFCMDPKLRMGRVKEEKQDIVSYIVDKISQVNPDYREGVLTTNIRTNNEVEEFIKVFFNKGKYPKANIEFKNITTNYFVDLNEMLEFSEYLRDSKNCTAISYSIYNNNDPLARLNINSDYSAHSIIGQEFDSVYLNLDENFKYDKYGNLIYLKEGRQPYFDPIQMAYQIGTRARRKIYINILNNLNLYKNSLETIMKK